MARAPFDTYFGILTTTDGPTSVKGGRATIVRKSDVAEMVRRRGD